MTYDQLKDLPPKLLIHEILKTLVIAEDIAAVPEFHHAGDNPLPAPTLCLIGDFEIRARFHELQDQECQVCGGSHSTIDCTT